MKESKWDFWKKISEDKDEITVAVLANPVFYAVNITRIIRPTVTRVEWVRAQVSANLTVMDYPIARCLSGQKTPLQFLMFQPEATLYIMHQHDLVPRIEDTVLCHYKEYV